MTDHKTKHISIEMPKEDILKSIDELKKKTLSLRFSKSNGTLVDTSLFKKHKKQIARLNTLLNIISS